MKNSLSVVAVAVTAAVCVVFSCFPQFRVFLTTNECGSQRDIERINATEAAAVAQVAAKVIQPTI